jgi:hypothetical protein
LDEVVELLAAALVAAGELTGEREEALHERLARRLVARVVVALEQPPVFARAQRPLILLGGRVCSGVIGSARNPCVDVLHAQHEANRDKAPGRWGAHVPRRVAGRRLLTF